MISMPEYYVVPSSALVATANAIKEKTGGSEVEFTKYGFAETVSCIKMGSQWKTEQITDKSTTLELELHSYTAYYRLYKQSLPAVTTVVLSFPQDAEDTSAPCLVVIRTGETPASITFPQGVVVPEDLTIEAHKHYEFLIQDGYVSVLKHGWTWLNNSSVATIGGGWSYTFSDGELVSPSSFCKINGRTCYSDSNRFITVGLRIINGGRYYFDTLGFMWTGWRKISSYAYYFRDPSGMAAVSESLTIGGIEYTFDQYGRSDKLPPELQEPAEQIPR